MKTNSKILRRLASLAMAFLMIFVMFPMSAFAVESGETRFDDVYPEDYYYESVSWAAENGIAAGTGANKFFPKLACTRAQVVTFLWRTAGRHMLKQQENVFSDVESDSVYYEAIMWAVGAGVTSGTGNSTFSPNQTCTRAQVVTFLWRAMGQPQPTTTTNPFQDVSESDYFYLPVLWAVENGITAGMSANTFAPYSPCTRGQVVTFLYRTVVEQ